MEWRLLIERIQELQREIAEISSYFACSQVDPSKKLLHERRHQRLQEIKEELAALRRTFRDAA